MPVDQNPYEHEPDLGRSDFDKSTSRKINPAPIVAFLLTILLVLILAICNPIVRHRPDKKRIEAIEQEVSDTKQQMDMRKSQPPSGSP